MSLNKTEIIERKLIEILRLKNPEVISELKSYIVKYSEEFENAEILKISLYESKWNEYNLWISISYLDKSTLMSKEEFEDDEAAYEWFYWKYEDYLDDKVEIKSYTVPQIIQKIRLSRFLRKYLNLIITR